MFFAVVTGPGASAAPQISGGGCADGTVLRACISYQVKGNTIIVVGDGMENKGAVADRYPYIGISKIADSRGKPLEYPEVYGSKVGRHIEVANSAKGFMTNLPMGPGRYVATFSTRSGLAESKVLTIHKL